MEKKALFNGGYHNLDITKNYLIETAKQYTIFIYKNLYDKLINAEYELISKLHDQKKIVTIDLYRDGADIILEDLALDIYPYIYMHIIDEKKVLEINPTYKQIPGTRALGGISRNSYKDIYELYDYAVAQFLDVDKVIYMDFRYQLSLFYSTVNYFFELVDSENKEYEDIYNRKYDIQVKNYKMNEPSGINEPIIRKVLKSKRFIVSTVSMLRREIDEV
ncbi:hypothetical protein ACOAOT_05435 [Lacrimispora sp. AGF001]|uniref:hypothetical protein n=1 Tax=Lacrimispora sp. AGF001 TaxID=3401631 RepID=UPI003B438CC6